ncbi:MMPL family transporter [Pseudonocardia humida]|uniref:MMPL family transporter n=1 Tax=Pseudonocardia humida TaxID=2800819 RepID=A0ABT0ZVU2_9PSEU|nr:MMPL family transporter [Pseudonocardia humida]MCO1654838.1 MMPL family transporter [Pseudonocardia humida]
MARTRDSGTNGPGRSTTVRLAGWSAGHPWRAVAGWLVFVALCVGAGSAVGTNQGSVSAFWIGEAGRAESMAAAAGLGSPAVENVLVTAVAGPLDEGAAGAAVRDVTRALGAVPGVAGVGAAVRSADGTALRVPVTMAGGTDDARKAVRGVLAWVAEVRADHPGVRIEQTGGPSISVGVNAKQGQDLARTEMISLPVTFLILFVVFGAVLAAGVPVLVAVTAFAGSVGLYGVASWVFPDAGGAAISVVFMLGMAVGVDYSLFTLKRVREERARGAGELDHTAAVKVAAATAGRAVVTSGVAVVVSLAGLYLADDVIFSSIATGAILVVAVSVLGSLTVLPALLVLLGGRIDGRLRRSSRHRAPAGATWGRMLGPALRRPVATLLVAVAVTVALAWPATTMRLGVEGKETFPASVPAVATYAQLTRLFPDQGAHHLVAVRAEPSRAGAVQDALEALAGRTAGDPHYAGAPQIRTSGATSTFRIAVPHPENSAPALASMQRLRAELLPQTLGRVPGVEYAVSGEIARGVDYSAHQAERIPWVIGFVCLATLLVMVVAFGSLVLAALGVLINLAAVAVAWGVLALVFQNRWAEDLLGFTSPGFVGSRMPLMVFAILVGLSTDYQIFVVSRIREAVRAGVPTRRAVVEGISATAGTVTSAAVIMISVFAGFLFIDRIEMKEVAVALTTAVLFDAVVLRILILPAAMTLLGERVWWPRHPGRTGAVDPGDARAARPAGPVRPGPVRGVGATGPGS